MDFTKIEIGAKLPGEDLAIEIIRTWRDTRTGMDAETRAAWDRIAVAQIKGWHNFWIGMGWPGEKV